MTHVVPGEFDVAILGGGSAAEAICAHLEGGRVAVVEELRVGGECPFVACIPSKTMLAAARRYRSAQGMAGGGSPDPRRAFAAAVAERDRASDFRDDASHLRELQESQVMVYRGTATLEGPGRVRVGSGGQEPLVLAARDVVIATGSVSAIPPIPGLNRVPVWKSDEALSSPELPDRLLVIGGGPVGCEMAQIYRSFGAEVTLVESTPGLLPREDHMVGALMRTTLEASGVVLHLGCGVAGCERVGSAAGVRLDCGEAVEVDRVLLAAGRRPRLEGIGLEAVGVRPDPGGLEVDDR